MATPVQRLQAIADGLLNRVAAPAELARIGEAAAFLTLDTEYATRTNADKASRTVAYLLKLIHGTVKVAEQQKAEMAARQAAAEAATDDGFVPVP